jgi:hypothetical protein
VTHSKGNTVMTAAPPRRRAPAPGSASSEGDMGHMAHPQEKRPLRSLRFRPPSPGVLSRADHRVLHRHRIKDRDIGDDV